VRNRASAATDEEILGEVIERVVEVAGPEKIVLFGSSSREDSDAHSDFDLLVVKSAAHRRKLAQEIYVALIGVEKAVDVIVATPEDVKRFKDSSALVIATALREGKTVYAA
jgi:uncharacterized protein